MLGGCAWIDTKQRELIYRPTPGSAADWPAVSDADELYWLPVAAAPGGQRLRAIWVPHKDPAAPAVLYLHGTRRNAFENRPKISAIHAAGFAVLAIDYRGFGDSTALLPSEETVVQDAEVAWRELVRRVPVPQQRVIYGHSMGGAVAIELASRQHATPPSHGALVLESTFTSMPAIAVDRYPWAALLDGLATQRFDSLARIGRIETPTWLLAGTADRAVSFTHSRRLYDAAARACELFLFDGGSHSGLHRQFAAAYRRVWADIAARMQQPEAAACGPPAARIVHVDARGD